MKFYLRIIIVITAISVLLVLAVKIVSLYSYNKTLAKQIEQIPKFEFKQLNGNRFSNDSLKNSSPIVLVYFNTECDLCGYEIESLINTVHHIEGLQILLISSESIDTILMFAERTIIPNSNLTTFLHDTDSLFPEMFDATNVPYTLLYNKEHKLIKRYKGQVKGETILKQIKEHERK